MDAPLPLDRLHPIYTAHHEAGHAVAYLHYQQDFTSVTIRSDDPSHIGRVNRDSTRTPRWIVGPIEAAGPAAEAYLICSHYQAGDQDGEADDDDVIVSAYLTLMDSLETHAELRSAVALSESAIREALNVVTREWECVSDIAAALLAAEDGTLDYEDCLRIRQGLAESGSPMSDPGVQHTSDSAR